MDIQEFAEQLAKVEKEPDPSSLMEALQNLRASDLEQLRERMAGIWYIWPWLSRDTIGDKLPQPLR